jgi:hypothetical protein
MKRIVTIAASVIVGILVLGISGAVGTKVYLHSHASRWWVVPVKDTKFQIAMYRYPRLHDIPESIGFGQGFVQLQESASGKILAQKDADDLAPLTSFSWSSDKAVIYVSPSTNEFASWDLPR